MKQFHLFTILTNYLHVSVILVVFLLSNFQQLPRKTMNVFLVSLYPLPKLKQCTAYHNLWDQITLSVLHCVYKSQSFWLCPDLAWGTPDKPVKLLRQTQLALLYGPALLPPVFAPHLSDTDCLRNQVIQHFRATGNFPKLLHNTSRNSSNHKLSFRPVYLDSLVWPLKKRGNQILTFTPRGNMKFKKRLSEKLHVWDNVRKFVYVGNTADY